MKHPKPTSRGGLYWIQMACFVEALIMNSALDPPTNTFVWFGLMMLGLATWVIDNKTRPEESDDG